jgi:hypothetical protein
VAAFPILPSFAHEVEGRKVRFGQTSARANIARFDGNESCSVYDGDVENDSWLERVQRGRQNWDAVVANLPYLPGSPNTLHIDVDGAAGSALGKATILHPYFNKIDGSMQSCYSLVAGMARLPGSFFENPSQGAVCAFMVGALGVGGSGSEAGCSAVSI